MGRVDSIVSSLNDVLNTDVDIMNNMLEAIYSLCIKCNPNVTYTDLVKVLREHGLDKEDIDILDFEFLRDNYLKEHAIAYDSLYASYAIMAEKDELDNYGVCRIRGMVKCPICGQMHNFYKQSENYSHCCSEVCSAIANRK